MIWITRKRNTAKYHLLQYDFSFCIKLLFVILSDSEESQLSICTFILQIPQFVRNGSLYLLYILRPVVSNQICK